MRNTKPYKRFRDERVDFSRWQAKILWSERYCRFHMRAKDLFLRILQQRPYGLCQFCQREIFHVLAVHEHAALQFATITARDETINTTDQSCFATTTCARNQKYFTGFCFK